MFDKIERYTSKRPNDRDLDEARKLLAIRTALGELDTATIKELIDQLRPIVELIDVAEKYSG